MLARAWAWLFGIASVAIVWTLSMRGAKQQGKAEQRANDAEAVNETVAEANRIADRVNSDAEFSDRVRDRFN